MKKTMKKDPNQHIKNCLLQVARAVTGLEQMRITVDRIDMNLSVPRITVYPGKGCKALKSYSSRHICRNGSRRVEKSALFEQCEIVWQQDAY
ncbi:hypothetical protein [Oceanospirillum sp.]|uniref:hypothetical protein n=1 Tax=Oceanospirillum sp. TaxID=2021254 RepID=UPI003A923D3E